MRNVSRVRFNNIIKANTFSPDIFHLSGYQTCCSVGGNSLPEPTSVHLFPGNKLQTKYDKVIHNGVD